MSDGIFDSYFKKVADREAKRTSTAIILGTEEPDRTAEHLKIGRELGVPHQAVSGAPDLFKSQVEAKRVADQVSSAPNLAQWLGDPVNGSLSKDDLENLTWFERNLGAGARAIGRGARTVSATPDYFGAVADSTRAGDIGKSYDDILAEEVARYGKGVGIDSLPPQFRVNALQVAQARFDAVAGQGEAERVEYIRRGADRLSRADEIIKIARDIPMSEPASQFRDNTLASADNTLMGTLGAFLVDPVGGAAFIAETAAETLPVLAAATAVTASTRTPATGALVMGGGSFLMENTSSAVGFLQEKGVDMSTPEAAAAVLTDVELLTEAKELGLERGIIIAAFDAVSGGVAGQTLINNPAGEMVAQGLAQMVLGGGGEASAQLATTGEVDMREVVIEALAELATAPIEVLGVGGRGMVDLFSKYSRSGETAAVIDQIDEVAQSSKVRERSVDKFLEALEASDIDDQTLFVSAEGLQEYFQAKDTIIDDEILNAWGIDTRDFSEKLASGGDVAVPATHYAARISGTEDAAWFRENAIFDPDEMSVSEASRFNDMVADIAEREFERMEEQRVKDSEQRTIDEVVFDEVFSQLRAAGRSPDVAQQEAAVMSAFYRTQYERSGDDGRRQLERIAIDISGPDEAQPRRPRGQLDIMLNTLRRRGDKALAPRGEGILDFVKGAGGVRDRGGDVEALGVPKGIVAETAAEVRERESQPNLTGATDFMGRGLGLDQLGRAMIEAGYFPEYMGGANIRPDGTVVDEATIALEAIAEASAGRERYIEGEGPDQGLVELMEALNERGIDLALSNDEIVAALESESDDWRSIEIEAVDEDGNTELMQAGEIADMINERLADAEAVLRCMDG